MIGFDGRDPLQAMCERGQEQLIATDYLSAAATLAKAEATAWDAQDFDTLARLYMPLQEARRQVRQRSVDGPFDCIWAGSAIPPTACADRILDEHPRGQFVVYGTGSVAVAAAVRRRAADRRLFAEAFLAALFPAPAGEEGTVVIVPLVDAPLPSADPRSTAAVAALLPPGCIILSPGEWPLAKERATPTTSAAVMALWEQLHAPFLAAAEAEPDPVHRMVAFRRTIAVDPACELAHQHLSDTAHGLARQLARRGA